MASRLGKGDLVRFIFLLIAIFIGFGFNQAEARSSTTRKAIVVGKAALYGLGGGLVIGLASQVISKNTRNIFIGGSLGMYAGIATGLYLVLTAGSGPKEYEGPDTCEDFSGWDSHNWNPSPATLQAKLPPKPELEINFYNFRF